MSRESIEELRMRLLRDPEIQSLIRMRAYEIYKLRAGEPGNQAEDWFRAEWEILQFLIEEESRREAKPADARSVAMTTEPIGEMAEELIPLPTAIASEPAESEAKLGTWSATEPHSTALAPPVGKATEYQMDAPTKPSRDSKTPSPRKTTAKSTTPGATETAKKTARRAAPKKTADTPAKSKKSRKKSDETKTAGGK